MGHITYPPFAAGGVLSQAQGDARYAAITTGIPQVASLTALRAVTGASDKDRRYLQGGTSAGDGLEGLFQADASDTTTADDGVNVIVDASNMRWKRRVSVISHLAGAGSNEIRSRMPVAAASSSRGRVGGFIRPL